MPKNKTRKSLLKRIRITRSGKIKLRRAHGRHLRSHKSGKLLRKYRRPKYAHASDLGRVKAMLFTKVASPERVAVEKQKVTEPKQDD
ncbi:MAG: 50S ribosomal protein L35 [Planctomycetota bacterium]